MASSSSSDSRKLARFSGHGKSGKIIGRSRDARLRARTQFPRADATGLAQSTGYLVQVHRLHPVAEWLLLVIVHKHIQTASEQWMKRLRMRVDDGWEAGRNALYIKWMSSKSRSCSWQVR